MEENSFFSAEYECIVKNLCEQITNAKTLIKLKKIFTDFAKHYTSIAFLYYVWEECAASFKNEKCFPKCEKDIKNLFKGYFENSKFSIISIVYQELNIIDAKPSYDYLYYKYIYYLAQLHGYSSVWYDPRDFFAETLHDITDYKEKIAIHRKLVQIPQSHMEFTFDTLKEYSEFPLDDTMSKKFEKAYELQEKMIKADKDSDNEKWFNYLLESNDQKCIELNVRFRITKYPFIKKLWKLYIEYLEITNVQMMLKTYSRYCRLFFKDDIMLEKYRNELQKYGTRGICVTKFWIDTIEFECFFVSAESAGRLLKRALNSYTVGPKGLIRYSKRFYKKNPNCIELCSVKRGNINLMEFDFQCRKNSLNSISYADEMDTDFSESFEKLFSKSIEYKKLTNQIHGSFRINLILNVINKSSISLLLKLLKTCKYYYETLRRLTCHYLLISDYEKVGIYGQALFLPASNISLNFKAVFLTNRLEISAKNPGILSAILPKLTSCNIRYLDIFKQNFTFKEYKFLTKYGNIETLSLEQVNIFDENGPVTAMEKIISLVPKVRLIVIHLSGIISCNSDLNLSCFQFKIQALSIGNADESLNIECFFEFIMKNCLAISLIFVDFEKETNQEFLLLLLKTWKNLCKLNEKFNSVDIEATNDFDTFLTLKDVENDDIF